MRKSAQKKSELFLNYSKAELKHDSIGFRGRRDLKDCVRRDPDKCISSLPPMSICTHWG